VSGRWHDGRTEKGDTDLGDELSLAVELGQGGDGIRHMVLVVKVAWDRDAHQVEDALALLGRFLVGAAAAEKE